METNLLTGPHWMFVINYQLMVKTLHAVIEASKIKCLPGFLLLTPQTCEDHKN